MIFILLITALFAYSCGENSFKSGGAAPPPKQNLEQQPAQGQSFQPVSFNIQEEGDYPVDIIFLIDGSGSMSQYAQRVVSNLPTLIQDFQQQNQSFNYQLFVVSEYSSFAQFTSEKYKYINRGIGSHNALQVGQQLVDEISGSSDSPIGLRDGSVKEFIVVSDDNSHTDPNAFKSWAVSKTATTGPVQVSGIVRLGAQCGGLLSVFSDAKPGTTYQMISQIPETRGVIQELCSDDWSMVFSNLSAQLTKRKKVAKTAFRLPVPVGSPNEIKVVVDGQMLQPQSEWTLMNGQVKVLRDLSQAGQLQILPNK